ncbi:ROK family glucokinase [Brevibacillus centrosporus]|uniref:ROK family glucokinase n=1 Tax=Brevibacillus centrosporus TaxID=54910 RepID=UPI000F09B0A5|nr:ROK family glucokinase [Brevibacillus centrosporus]MEC2130257.1 ROK family glucokinase [Brevibacillus centrosporus]RNB70973.1 ROK family glucokinase [Brevibacillus centrosporus]GED30287.1 glucokinase [Brevibacillus centrosporus]
MQQIIVGVDVGGTAIKMALITPDGELVAKTQEPTPVAQGEDGVLQKIAEMADALLAQHEYSKAQTLGIGVGVPGPIDAKNGIVMQAVNLHWRKPVPLREKLKALSGLPVAVENDANMAALGEMWQGAGQGAEDLVAITLGTGVGGGIIVHGNVVHGINGVGGEIGHITMTPGGGSICNCGKTGCLETYTSATAIIREGKLAATNGTSPALAAALAQHGELKAKNVLDAAKEGDTASLAIVEQATLYLGLALSHLAILLNPAKIVIGGGVAAAGEFLFSRVRESFARFVPFTYVVESTQIVAATLGNDAGVYGAGWLIRSQMTE